MRILITGAAGFVGRHLLQTLKMPGSYITAVDRRSAKCFSLANKAIISDLLKEDALESVLGETDAIIHLADGLNVFESIRGFPWDGDYNEKIRATGRLADKAARAGVKTFIYMSSIKAMCDEHYDVTLTEETTPHPTTFYGRLKLKTEQHLLNVTDSGNMQLVIIRNPIVYGPGSNGNMNKLLKLADTSLPIPLANLNNKRSLISITNLCSAFRVVLERMGGPRGVFLVQDKTALSTSEIIKILRRALGRHTRLFPLSSNIWSVGRQLPFFGPHARRLSGSITLSDNKFRQCFDWEPPYPTAQCLEDMALAYQQTFFHVDQENRSILPSTSVGTDIYSYHK